MNIALERAFQLIEHHSAHADFEQAKDDSLLLAAGVHLGLTFPPSYRVFLKRYGAGSIAGLEIHGLIKEDFARSGVPDVVWVTMNHRADDFTHKKIFISGVGNGQVYSLDL